MGLAIAAVAGDDLLRKPKLFYVSTSATTSTLSTYSVCYQSTGGAPEACAGKRKRRTIDSDGITILDPLLNHLLQRVYRMKVWKGEETEGSSCIGSPPHLFPLQHPSLQHSPYLVLGAHLLGVQASVAKHWSILPIQI